MNIINSINDILWTYILIALLLGCALWFTLKTRFVHFIGGPAYYMRKGLKQPWMGTVFAILITITFGFAFNSVQSNTLCAAFEHAFGFDMPS